MTDPIQTTADALSSLKRQAVLAMERFDTKRREARTEYVARLGCGYLPPAEREALRHEVFCTLYQDMHLAHEQIDKAAAEAVRNGGNRTETEQVAKAAKNAVERAATYANSDGQDPDPELLARTVAELKL